MNAQLSELLCRIPCSPETDELQDFLTIYEQELHARIETKEREAAAWKAVAERYRDACVDLYPREYSDQEYLDEINAAFDTLTQQLKTP